MIKDFARRPSSRLIAYCLTFGVLGVGMPRVEAAGVSGPVAGLHKATRGGQSVEASIASDATRSIAVFVELAGEPALKAYARAQDAAAVLEGDSVSRSAGVAAGRSQAVSLRAQHAAVLPALQRLGGQVIFEAHRAVNGIALRVDARQLPALRALPGVKGVHVMVPKEIDNATSVPYLNIPQSVWDAAGAGVTGAGVKVGIIDTGIDYQHANFGGTGALADYQANDRTVISESGNAAFPTAKVVGGWDFAGDAYTAANAAVPDPDPMDCNGHGSHVAGTAAGWGVTSAGTTFTGPYDGTATFSTLGALRIGPGTAPQAELYALRVFGCTGSTNLTTAAIEWAMDPNDDDDFSDHLDVINMSLGSSFGSLFDDSVEASNNAAAAGVIVVTSAGNSGDVYFVTGAPGGAAGAVSVAASTDAITTVRTNLAGANAVLNAGTASFGPSIGLAPVPAADTDIVRVDESGGSAAANFDGCCGTVSPWKCAAPNTWTNAAALAGKIALVDRGVCEFAVKAYNAQLNGALGVVIANNQGGTVTLSMGPSVAAPEVNPLITVPTSSVSQNDGNTLKANLAGLQGDMVVNTSAGNTLASFSSRGPRRAWSLKPDVAAPGASITSTQTGVVCKTGTANCAAPTAPAVDAFAGFSPNSAALTIGGTSMAAPHVAGIMATLKQLHPTWSATDLRALVISTSSGDIFTGLNSTGAKYGPGRIGTGLVDVTRAVTSDVVLGDGADFLSVAWERPGETFGTEVSKAFTASRSVSVKNKGTASHTYNVSYVPFVDNPGIAVGFPNGGSITVGPKKKVNLKVSVSSTGPDSVSPTRDASVASVQSSPFLGNIPRSWLDEEAGYIVLTPTSEGDAPLRMAFHMAPRPVASLLAKKFGSTLELSGNGFEAPSALTSIPFSVPVSTFLEWQATSPNEDQASGDPQIERLLDSADLREVGVSSDLAVGGHEVFFGLSTWGNWSTPNEVEFRVYVDANRDGTDDFYVFNGNSTRSLNISFGDTSYNDTFLTHLCSMAGSCLLGEDYLNGIDPSVLNLYPYNNNVAVLALWVPDATVPITGPFNYHVQAYNREGGLVDAIGSAASPLTYDPLNPGIDYNTPGAFAGPAAYLGEPGTQVPNLFNAANFTANDSLGALVLHYNNAGPNKTNAGKRSETLALSSWVSIGDASIVEGNSGKKNLTFTVSLNAPATSSVTVKLQTADDTATVADADYTAKTSTMSFAVGQQSKPFSVSITGDTNSCPDTTESFFVNITSTTGAAIADGQAVGTIETDDPGCP
jgi:subtilisin family serine protease